MTTPSPMTPHQMLSGHRPQYPTTPNRSSLIQSSTVPLRTYPLPSMVTGQRQPTTNTHAEIIGRIKSIKAKGIFVVHTESMGRDFTCVYEGFCPVSEDDAIHAQGVLEQHPNFGLQLRITQPPFVQLAMDRDSIVRCFIRVLRGTGFGDRKANQLFTVLAERSGSEKQVSSYMSELAAMWHEHKDADLLSSYSDVVNATQLQKLLSWWYKQRSLRRLYLLGLNNREIEACCSYAVWRTARGVPNHDSLYEQCVTNPFVLVPLGLDKCHQIMSRLGRQAEPNELRCAQIARKIYDLMTNKGWVGTPIQTINQFFPDTPYHTEKLKEEYGLVIEMDTAYLRYPHQVETRVSDRLHRLLQQNLVNDEVALESKQRETANFMSKTLSEDQKQAIQMALDYNVSIITGGAGTGKTTVIGELVHNLELREIPYQVTSFTGKAVARDREVIKRKCPATMHRLIAQADRVPVFRHLIIDEASMVTTETMYQFMSRFAGQYKITLVGDPNQLQPIGWGALFEQLIASGRVPITKLTTNHRYLGGANVTKDGVIANAQQIIDHIPTEPATIDPFAELHGDWEDYDEPDTNQAAPFDFIPTENFAVLEGSVELVYDIIRLLYQNNIRSEDLTIVTPYNADLKNLNQTYQQIYNEGARSIVDVNGTLWATGDRVMMLENNYDINVMNGEEGMVTDVSTDAVMVTFKDGAQYTFKIEATPKSSPDDPVDEYGKRELTTRMIGHSFAVTCHRAQGSEWEYVIVYVPNNGGNRNGSFLYRNLVYTAITRARRAVWLVGDISGIRAAATRAAPPRHDNLSRRLQDMQTIVVETDGETEIIVSANDPQLE